MKLIFKETYKSIKLSGDYALPNFIVLTGLNGAGKTQFLQAINNKKILIEKDGVQLTSVSLFNSGFGSLDNSKFHGNDFERAAIEFQSRISNYCHQNRNGNNSQTKLDAYFNQSELNVLKEILKQHDNDESKLLGVSRAEIMKNMPFDFKPREYGKGYYQARLFQENISEIFKKYQILQERNIYNNYLRDVKGRANVEVLSAEEFNAKYGEPPWILVNQILDVARLSYKFSSPEGQEIDEPFQSKLISSIHGAEISLSDLSSGEAVLMSLALAAFGAYSDYRLPRVLLLDEPDCHLHPSMVINLLKVLEDVFVKSKNMVVIMTTHSPSTVALASSESLFSLSATDNKFEKESKDKCIKNLTSGIPALSIEYDNRIQIFVESKHDAKNYGGIYEILKSYMSNDVSLNFISSGSGGSGSCEQVKEIVKLLRSNGNSKVYGIVDWDGSNVSTDFIKVPAIKRRYSLENMIFDPLLISFYLVREGLIKGDKVKFIDDINYVKLSHLSPGEYEILAGSVVDCIYNHLPNKNHSSSFLNISYVGGLEISVPDWFLKYQGHSLEESIKNAYPPLKRFRGENDFKNAIIGSVMKDYPEFIPYDFIDLFLSVSNQHIN